MTRESANAKLLRMFDDAAEYPTVRAAIRALLLPDTVSPEPDAPCSFKGSWGDCRKWRSDPVHVRPDERKQSGQHVWRNDR